MPIIRVRMLEQSESQRMPVSVHNTHLLPVDCLISMQSCTDLFRVIASTFLHSREDRRFYGGSTRIIKHAGISNFVGLLPKPVLHDHLSSTAGFQRRMIEFSGARVEGHVFPPIT